MSHNKIIITEIIKKYSEENSNTSYSSWLENYSKNELSALDIIYKFEKDKELYLKIFPYLEFATTGNFCNFLEKIKKEPEYNEVFN